MSKDESRKSVPLRVPTVSFQAGVWPCPEDKLGRKKEIENLSPVLLNVEAPLVLAVDAPWGAGKTTFIKLWEHYLNTQGMVSLYLNCWENDFVDDPLLPILSVMDSWLSEQNDSSIANDAWIKAKRIAPGLLKSATVAAAKVTTFGALDLEKEYEKVLADMAGSAIGDLVDSFNVKKKIVGEFKKHIAKAMDCLPDEQQNLIIFIDELDRCRPTYAIEVLERMKHLFDIERVVFVIAINRQQLSKSLQGVYGPSFDGEHYLKRFIDLDYQLTVTDQIGYINMRINQKDIQNCFAPILDGQREFETFSRIIKGLVKRFDYRLRDIDQLIMRFRLILRSVPKNDTLDPVVLASLLILREQNSKLYRQFRDDGSCVNEVIKFLIGDADELTELPDYFGAVAGWLVLSAMDYYHPELLSKTIEYWKTLHKNLDSNSKNYRQITHLLKISESSSGMRDPDNLRLLTFNRVELVDEIKFIGD